MAHQDENLIRSPSDDKPCGGCTLLCEMPGPLGSTPCIEQSLNTFDRSIEFRINGQVVDAHQAASAAHTLLSRAKRPLFTGLKFASTEFQQQVVNVARQSRGIVDNGPNDENSTSLFTLQRQGAVTATIGEVRDRAQTVIFWFCSPDESHPNLLSRIDAPNSTLIHIGPENHLSQDEKRHGTFIQIEYPQARHALAVCTALINGIRLDESTVERTTGQPLKVWRELVEHIQSLDYAANFFSYRDRPKQMMPEFDSTFDRLTEFTVAMNRSTRIVTLNLRQDDNGLSGENVQTWSTGFSIATDLCRQQPRFHYLENSTSNVLKQRSFDAAFVLCPNEEIEPAITDVDRVVFYPSGTEPAPNIKDNGTIIVSVHTNQFFIGDWCRFDDVVIPVGMLADDEDQSLAQFFVELIENGL